jgi:hypothetical protein
VSRINPVGYIIAGTLLALLGLSGCATMDRSQCQTVDWRTIGYEDGVTGQSSDRIALHRKACAKYGVTPDLQAYQAGREQGLQEYCNADNGFRLGERGGQLPAFCPVERYGAFEAAYRDGFHLYQLRSSLNAAQAGLDAARREQQGNEHRLVELSDLIVAKETETVARAQAVIEVKNIAERQGRLKSRIRELEQQRALRQRDLDDYLFAMNNPR